jgi:hypothetical protein
MRHLSLKHLRFFILFMLVGYQVPAQVIITQYYEGTGTNKWIELTNMGNTTVNTASPQLRLGLWAITGSTGNINISGAPSQVMDLTVSIPAHGSVLIGNPANGTEVPYLNSGSGAQNNSQVINFNGNDGIALLDASNNIIDAFGQGINAPDRSYWRNLSVTNPSASFQLSEWTLASLANVQNAAMGNPERLNYHLDNNCQAPSTIAGNIVYYTVSSTAIGGAFSPAIADEYLVLVSSSPSLSMLPQNGQVYQANDLIGNATVINRSSGNSFYATGLNPSTTYYFFIFSLNSNCIGGPVYYTGSYLTATKNTTAIPAPQPYQVYFGNLHAHSGFSDGNADDPTKTPADDYAFAKESMCMDFLGISEHNHTGAGMSLANWQPGLTQAAAATSANFLAMYGMEFGVINDGGHAVIYGMDSLMGWEPNQYQSFVARGNFNGPAGLFEKINQHQNNSFVYLAHPELTDFNNIFLDPYAAQADEAIVGCALETGPANSTSVNYNNPGSSMAFLDYYKILLSKGYHLGPTIDHDNHNMTFGRTARTRLAIIAPQLTQASVLEAMRNMRFYATQDCSAKISFTIAGELMGTVMVRSGAPVISVSTETAAPIASIRIMAGTPGSGLFPVEIASFNSATVNFTDLSLSNFNERYYYLDITETDGTRIITAPIWYARVDGTVAISGFQSFIALNQPQSVLLKWTTLGDDGHTRFEIERSVDAGRSFVSIGSLNGVAGSSSTHNYHFTDHQPAPALSYYRIKAVDINSPTKYSVQRVINREGKDAMAFSIRPNPADAVANIVLYGSSAGPALFNIYDNLGKLVRSYSQFIAPGEQIIQMDIASLTPGNYFVQIQTGGKLLSRQLYKK